MTQRGHMQNSKHESISDAAESSAFLYESSHTLENWDSKNLEELVSKFNSTENTTEDRFKTFTLLFETQIGRDLSDIELKELTKKLSKAERRLSEIKSNDFDGKLPLKFRQEIANSIGEMAEEGNRTARFIDSQLIEGAAQAVPIVYRYILLMTPEEDWPEA